MFRLALARVGALSVRNIARRATACLLLLTFAGPASAAGSGLKLQTVTIAAGKLVVTGTTARPRVRVTIPGTSFQTTSNARSEFSFNILFRPDNCRLTLATNTGVTTALVSLCGPQGKKGARGLTGLTGPEGPDGLTGPEGPIRPSGPEGTQGPAGPQGLQGQAGPRGPQGATGPQGGPGVTARGAWSASTNYVLNDLVLSGGTTWRALKANSNSAPAAGNLNWEVFAAIGNKGDDGDAGPRDLLAQPGPQDRRGRREFRACRGRKATRETRGRRA